MTPVICCLCGRQFSERDPQPIGDQGAEFFNKPADSYVCFWCVQTLNDEPGDPTPPRFQEGRG
jgi:hypothetical protein